MEERETTTAAKKRKCSYNEDQEPIYPWLKQVQGDSFVMFAGVIFLFSQRGEYDMKQHRKYSWKNNRSLDCLDITSVC